jgi:hypothetical protein
MLIFTTPFVFYHLFSLYVHLKVIEE